jgi:Brp/Blh family beta-carotene 15,15'-monooxygenase
MDTKFNTNYQNFTLYFTVFLFWISIQFGEVVEDFIAYILVISIGILHGANDLLILSKRDQNAKSFKKNILIYLSIIGFCLLIFFISPFLAILLFVFGSAYHFGEEHLSTLVNVNLAFNFLYFFSYGMFIFSLLFYQSVADVDLIMLELTGVTFTFAKIEGVLFLSAVLLVIGSLYLVVSKKISAKNLIKEAFYLFLFFLVFKTSSLILGFAIYFILWHSIPSIIHQIAFVSGDLTKKNILFYLKKALVYWAISIAGLLLLYFLLPNAKLLSTVVFVILFAVTAPHTWVMHRMKS